MLKTPCGSKDHRTFGSLMGTATQAFSMLKPQTESSETQSMVFVTQMDDQQVENIIVGYFTDIFSTQGDTNSTILIDAIEPVVTTDMNDSLTQEFTVEEVHRALKQMHPKKSPRPNGMPPFFYQHFWSLIGDCVTKTVLNFFNHNIIPPKFNETHVVLILKIKNPKKITQYRPISLTNVMSRIASKVLANHLRRFLPQIISENQSTFMSNRLITDNVLVAYETMHHINQKRSGKVGEMALKLDMSKAFDRVEWGCLEKIMSKMGFHESWVKLMMRCVSTVTYSIKINGRPRGHVTPSRGLHQGDPLSPFLFLFCAKGLSALIRKSVEFGLLSGVAACPRGPKISHLFFVDDSLMFCKANIEECSTLKEILDICEYSTGQQLNREKTSLFFSRKTPQEIQEAIKNRFGADII